MKVKYVGWDGYNNFGDDETKTIIEAMGFEHDENADVLMIGAGTLLPLRYQLLDKIGNKKYRKKICFCTGVTEKSDDYLDYDVDMKYTRKFLEDADFIGIRSQRERDILEMGEVIGDPFFMTDKVDNEDDEKKYVVLNVGSGLGKGYGGVKKELNAFIEMLDFVKEELIEKQGKNVIVLSVWNMDYPLANLASNYLKVKRIDKIPNLQEMYEILSKAEYVIGYKLHTMIACLTLNIPFMQVEYARKIRFVAEEFGLEDNLVRVDEINRENLLKSYEAMKKWNHKEIEEKREVLYKKQFDFFTRIMESEKK